MVCPDEECGTIWSFLHHDVNRYNALLFDDDDDDLPYDDRQGWRWGLYSLLVVRYHMFQHIVDLCVDFLCFLHTHKTVSSSLHCNLKLNKTKERFKNIKIIRFQSKESQTDRKKLLEQNQWHLGSFDDCWDMRMIREEHFRLKHPQREKTNKTTIFEATGFRKLWSASHGHGLVLSGRQRVTELISCRGGIYCDDSKLVRLIGAMDHARRWKGIARLAIDGNGQHSLWQRCIIPYLVNDERLALSVSHPFLIWIKGYLLHNICSAADDLGYLWDTATRTILFIPFHFTRSQMLDNTSSPLFYFRQSISTEQKLQNMMSNDTTKSLRFSPNDPYRIKNLRRVYQKKMFNCYLNPFKRGILGGEDRSNLSSRPRLTTWLLGSHNRKRPNRGAHKRQSPQVTIQLSRKTKNN